MVFLLYGFDGNGYDAGVGASLRMELDFLVLAYVIE